MEQGIPLAAVDDGYAQTKLYGDDGQGNVVRYRMRSSVRSGRWGLGAIDGSSPVGLYDTEQGPFTVSEDVEAENTQFDGFHLSVMNRVLVNHALISAGYGGREISLMAGLPVADFFVAGFKDEEKVEAKRRNLMKPVTLTSGDGKVAAVKDVTIGCQAVAAWIDYALDDKFEERVDLDGTVAIVDIGGRTTDIATVVKGQSVDHAHSGTADIGVLDVYTAIRQAIWREFKIRDPLSLDILDRAVRTGTIRLFNGEQDVSTLVAEAVRESESKIAREVERRIGSAATMAAVLFVGGGSALFKAIPAMFRHGVLLEDPEFANARGLYKYARYLARE